LVRLCRVDQAIDQEELIQDLIYFNPFLNWSKGDLKFAFWRNGHGKRYRDAILNVTPRIYGILMQQKKLQLCMQTTRITSFSRFIQCGKCLKFGHTLKNCLDPDGPFCGWCAGDHLTADCEKLGSSRCHNCEVLNKNLKYSSRYRTDHDATTQDCPVLKRALKAIERSTLRDPEKS